MNTSVLTFFLIAEVLSTVPCLTIKRFETTPKPSTTTSTTLPFTTVSPHNTNKTLKANGPIVVLQHHGTLDGPSGRFQQTVFESAPPVNLSLPPVFLPEFVPIFEDNMDLVFAASNDQPKFARTENLTDPPIDLSLPIVLLPEASPITESSQEVDAGKQALLFVRG